MSTSPSREQPGWAAGSISQLAYGLVALFVVTILHTFNNLSGLQLEYLGSTAVFCDEDAEIELLLNCEPNQSYENVQVGYPQGSTATADLIDTDQLRLKIFVPAAHRGWLNPGRLRVETTFPFGIIRCWT